MVTALAVPKAHRVGRHIARGGRRSLSIATVL
jgi:hypothetical protein